MHSTILPCVALLMVSASRFLSVSFPFLAYFNYLPTHTAVAMAVPRPGPNRLQLLSAAEL